MRIQSQQENIPENMANIKKQQTQNHHIKHRKHHTHRYSTSKYPKNTPNSRESRTQKNFINQRNRQSQITKIHKTPQTKYYKKTNWRLNPSEKQTLNPTKQKSKKEREVTARRPQHHRVQAPDVLSQDAVHQVHPEATTHQQEPQ